MKTLFISYRRKTWPFTHRLAERLRTKLAADIFVDVDGVDDVDFQRSILGALEASDAVLLILSPETFDLTRINSANDWVRREIAYALELGKPLLMAGIDGLVPPDPSTLPDDVRDVTTKQSIEFYPGFFEAGVDRLAAFIEKATPIERRATVQRRTAMRSGIGLVALVVLIGAVTVLLGSLANQPPSPTQTARPTTAVAMVPTLSPAPLLATSVPLPTTIVLSATATPLPPSATRTRTLTATSLLPTLTEAPTEPSEDFFLTLWAGQTETSIAQSWTPTLTFTPTLTPSKTLTLTRTPNSQQRAALTLTQAAANSTATATLWTKSPTRTYTPTPTFTPTPTYTYAPSATPTPTLIPAGTTLTPTIYARTTVKDVSLVLVPRGCFVMGSDQSADDEKPAHEVCITQSYFIGEFEVTNAQFEAYEKETGKTRADVSSDCKTASSAPQQPVVCVSWTEATIYTIWMGCRLPTEAEWEYAARSPASLTYPWGNTFDKTKGNTSETGLGKTELVGKFTGGGSWVGALDMAGNVWEFVGDWRDNEYYTNRPKPDYDPTGPTSGQSRLLRGSSWIDDSGSARAASRYWGLSSADRNHDTGFRVVCGRPPSLSP